MFKFNQILHYSVVFRIPVSTRFIISRCIDWHLNVSRIDFLLLFPHIHRPSVVESREGKKMQKSKELLKCITNDAHQTRSLLFDWAQCTQLESVQLSFSLYSTYISGPVGSSNSCYVLRFCLTSLRLIAPHRLDGVSVWINSIFLWTFHRCSSSASHNDDSPPRE